MVKVWNPVTDVYDDYPLDPFATDSTVVHDTGDETIAGVKTFSSDPIIPDEVYGVGWNGSLEPPTKNAVYDKIETIGGGVSDGDKGHITVSGSGATWNIDSSGMSAIAADSALTGAFKSLTTDRHWVGAGSFSITASTPTLSFVASGGSRPPAWLMDASTAEGVGHGFVVPAGWATYHLDYYWTNAGAGSGDVRWQIQTGSWADTEALGSGHASTTVTATAPSQDVLKVSRVLTSEACTPGEYVNLRVIRSATEGTDTLANDAGFLGALLTRAS